jgi:hypothetical protein
VTGDGIATVDAMSGFAWWLYDASASHDACLLAGRVGGGVQSSRRRLI